MASDNTKSRIPIMDRLIATHTSKNCNITADQSGESNIINSPSYGGMVAKLKTIFEGVVRKKKRLPNGQNSECNSGGIAYKAGFSNVVYSDVETTDFAEVEERSSAPPVGCSYWSSETSTSRSDCRSDVTRSTYCSQWSACAGISLTNGGVKKHAVSTGQTHPESPFDHQDECLVKDDHLVGKVYSCPSQSLRAGNMYEENACKPPYRNTYQSGYEETGQMSFEDDIGPGDVFLSARDGHISALDCNTGKYVYAKTDLSIREINNETYLGKSNVRDYPPISKQNSPETLTSKTLFSYFKSNNGSDIVSSVEDERYDLDINHECPNMVTPTVASSRNLLTLSDLSHETESDVAPILERQILAPRCSSPGNSMVLPYPLSLSDLCLHEDSEGRYSYLFC